MILKAKGQPIHVAKHERLAFWLFFPCSSDWIEHLAANLKDAGSNPARGTNLIRPTTSANCLQGLASGLHQRQGFYAHCHFGAFSVRKQGQNDVPQLPERDGESRFLRKKQGSAVQVQAMRQAIR